jgi:DNA transformation protein
MPERKLSARTRMKPLGSSAGFETFVIDQLSELGDVVSRKMFGGVGLYCDGIFFGLIARDQLYLKVDAATRGFFESAGSTPFRPYDDRPAMMQYYGVPLEVLEAAPDLVKWARRAVETAARAGAKPGRLRQHGTSSRKRLSGTPRRAK